VLRGVRKRLLNEAEREGLEVLGQRGVDAPREVGVDVLLGAEPHERLAQGR